MEVKLRTLPRQIAGVLVGRIHGGAFADGAFPSESEIAQEFGVSRGVAREAFKILASLDMVDIAQGRRVALRPEFKWDYLSPLLIDWLPRDRVWKLLHDMHDARLIFEPAIAREAAGSLTEQDLSRLGKMLKEMASTEHDPDAYLAVDLEFHLEICRATRNRILTRFMYSSRWWQTASRHLSNQAPDALPIATKQHEAIYEALVARDSGRAEAAMREHLQATNTTLTLIDRQEARKADPL